MSLLMCAECGLRQPNYGMPSDAGRVPKRPQWCSKCIKEHPGAVRVSKKLCDDCYQTIPSFGIPGEKGPAGGTVLRWCQNCAKSHEGAKNLINRQCEDCQSKLATCNMPRKVVVRAIVLPRPRLVN